MRQPPNMSPSFGDHVPLIGQQRVQQQAQVQAAINQAIQQLAQQIYVSLATALHQLDSDEHGQVDPDRLRQCARNAMSAATAYFEGIGVIQPREGTPFNCGTCGPSSKKHTLGGFDEGQT